MRVLFITFAWPSHFYPIVPFAWAFQAAGHEVRVATQPSLLETVSRAGVTAVPVGYDVDLMAMLRPFYRWVAEQPRPVEWADLRKNGAETLGMYVTLAWAMTDDTIAHCRDWRPDLIVHEATSYAGPLAGAALGIPAVRHIYGVDYTYQGREFEDEALAQLCAHLGVESVETLGMATVDPCPPSMQVPAPVRRFPMRYVPYNGPAVFPDWLNEPPKRRRIGLTWGTSTSKLTSGRMFIPPRVVEAARELDVELVISMTARDGGALGALPPGTRVAERLPLHLLVPTCDVLVHQGGNGTLLNAALYGVPQLALPQLPDQTFYTNELARSGAGAVLKMNEVGVETIAARLDALLTEPSYAASAQRIREEMLAQPTTLETAEAVTKLAIGA
jgi:UDP:flavonoid glycosyltransferase YjiC (YdhE family)